MLYFSDGESEVSQMEVNFQIWNITW
jgi:hypothetical protein